MCLTLNATCSAATTPCVTQHTYWASNKNWPLPTIVLVCCLLPLCPSSTTGASSTPFGSCPAWSRPRRCCSCALHSSTPDSDTTRRLQAPRSSCVSCITCAVLPTGIVRFVTSVLVVLSLSSLPYCHRTSVGPTVSTSDKAKIHVRRLLSHKSALMHVQCARSESSQIACTCQHTHRIAY